MDESHRNDSAAVLVGKLIRSYRDDLSDNRRRLTQEGLLSLMVELGEEYAVNLDRSRLSNWETGKVAGAAGVPGGSGTYVRHLAACHGPADEPCGATRVLEIRGDGTQYWQLPTTSSLRW